MTGLKPALEMRGAVVLVTGGAKGIGRAIASAFLEAGATVVVCGRTAPPQTPVQDRASATYISCDVRDPLAVERLFESIAATYGRLDVLINKSGGSPPRDVAAG